MGQSRKEKVHYEYGMVDIIGTLLAKTAMNKKRDIT